MKITSFETLNKNSLVLAILFCMLCLPLCISKPCSAQVTYGLRGLSTYTTMNWTYDGPVVFVSPGDRFANGYGYGAELAVTLPQRKSFAAGIDVGYRASRFVELTQYPRLKPTEDYTQHRAYARPRVSYVPLSFLDVELSYALSFRINDLGASILEDYRGLSTDELRALPDFNDPIGAGGVYMNGSAFNHGPSIGITGRFRQWSFSIRYDYLFANQGERTLREIAFESGGTVPLQTTRWRFSEWTFGVGYRLGGGNNVVVPADDG